MATNEQENGGWDLGNKEPDSNTMQTYPYMRREKTPETTSTAPRQTRCD